MFFLAYIAYSSIYVARLNFSVASVLLEADEVVNKTQSFPVRRNVLDIVHKRKRPD